VPRSCSLTRARFHTSRNLELVTGVFLVSHLARAVLLRASNSSGTGGLVTTLKVGRKKACVDLGEGREIRESASRVWLALRVGWRG